MVINLSFEVLRVPLSGDSPFFVFSSCAFIATHRSLCPMAPLLSLISRVRASASGPKKRWYVTGGRMRLHGSKYAMLPSRQETILLGHRLYHLEIAELAEFWQSGEILFFLHPSLPLLSSLHTCWETTYQSVGRAGGVARGLESERAAVFFREMFLSSGDRSSCINGIFHVCTFRVENELTECFDAGKIKLFVFYKET